MFTYEAVTSTPAADPCAPRVTEGNYRTRVYKDLGFTEEQQAVWDSLIDWRQKTINDIYALPRIKSDSVRRETESKQLALLTATSAPGWMNAEPPCGLRRLSGRSCAKKNQPRTKTPRDNTHEEFDFSYCCIGSTSHA
jgi:hypothetical protein